MPFADLKKIELPLCLSPALKCSATEHSPNNRFQAAGKWLQQASWDKNRLVIGEFGGNKL